MVSSKFVKGWLGSDAPVIFKKPIQFVVYDVNLHNISPADFDIQYVDLVLSHQIAKKVYPPIAKMFNYTEPLLYQH